MFIGVSGFNCIIVPLARLAQLVHSLACCDSSGCHGIRVRNVFKVKVETGPAHPHEYLKQKSCLILFKFKCAT